MSETLTKIGNQSWSDSSTYHVVVVRDEEEAFVVHFDTVANMVEGLKKFVGTNTCVFPFYGIPWAVSKGPTHRYLLSPTGDRYPLFKEEPVCEVDPTGSLSLKERPVTSQLRP